MKRFLKQKYQSIKSRVKRSAAEQFRLRSVCRRARDQLDELLDERLPPKGTYLEAGALDGFHASNTYYLDRVKGWKGVLVEPNPYEFEACKRFRRRAYVVNCALVPFEYQKAEIEIVYGHDLTWTQGAYSGSELRSREDLLERYGLAGEKIVVAARTLQSVIEDYGSPITFMSLDVEGFELSVLKGLNLRRSGPEFLLIECQTTERYAAIADHLKEHYDSGEKLSRHDYFFSKRSSGSTSV